MFGKIGDLAGVLKQAKQMQSQFQQVQAELTNQRYDGEAGAGLVRATVNGRAELVDIKIDPKATDDVELLEDLVKSSVAAAAQKAHEGAAAEMQKMTGGIDPSALAKMLGMQE